MNLRDIKKDIDYLFGAFVEDCSICATVNPELFDSAIADIMEAGRQGRLEEVFGTGTAAVVSPVKQLTWMGEDVFIGDGKIGPLTQKLYDTLTDIQWGRIPDTRGWIRKIK